MLVRLHGHHKCPSPIEVITQTLGERLLAIRAHKPTEELPTRERLMRDVEVELPADLAGAFTECQRAYAESSRVRAEWERVRAEWERLCNEHMPLLVKLHDELCVRPQRAAGFDCVWTPEHPSIF